MVEHKKEGIVSNREEDQQQSQRVSGDYYITMAA